MSKEVLNKLLSRLRNRTHWNQTLYPQWNHHYGCNALGGEYALAEWIGVEKRNGVTT